jgi:MoaA/NifB/PqqE/SkfB family radical SAM enzyme
MKRILGTGFSKGLGKCIVDKLKADMENVYKITDFSRSSGVDLTKEIPDFDCDILILNAGVWENDWVLNFEVPYKLAEQMPKDKLVIFILSNAAYQSYGNDFYTASKSGLLHYAQRKQREGYNFATISPGTVKTGFTGAENEAKGCMKPEVVAELVYQAILAWENGALVREMIVTPIKEKLMYSKKGAQGEFFYYDDGDIESFRYNPGRKRNRLKADHSYRLNKPLNFPTHLIVETSSRCNLKCSFCCREQMTRPQTDMSMDIFKKVADEGLKHGVYSMSMYALGEPLLNKDLPGMIKYAKYRGLPYMDISTNGMYSLEPLLHTELDDIIISLDGLKERHEKLRIGAKYEKVIENAGRFIALRNSFGKKKPTVRLQIINFPEAQEDVKSFILSPPFPADMVYVKNVEAFSHVLGDTNIGKAEVQKRLSDRIPCPQLWFVLTITADGNICACCHDAHGDSVVGSIEKMSLKQAWKELSASRKRHYEGDYRDFNGLCSACSDFSW